MTAGSASQAWNQVLDALDAEMDAAETDLGLVPSPRPVETTGGSTGSGSAGTPLTLPDALPLAGLAVEELAALRRRLATLQGRQNALVSRVTAAMTANRRHRALLERAESAHDRPVHVDRRA